MCHRLAVVLTLLAGFLVVSPGTAYACSCAPTKPKVRMDDSHAVFSGVVTEHETLGEPFASVAVFTMRVDSVYKGDLTATTQVKSSEHSSSCGAELAVGTRYLIFARTGDEFFGRDVPDAESVPLSTTLCSGNRAVTGSGPLTTENVQPDIFGTPATDLIPVLGTPRLIQTPTPPQPTTTTTAAQETGAASPWWLITLLPVAALLAYVLFRRKQT
ncbi:hypothetical protein Aph01nite_29540 [Acrocarpospora phusangensis]|uniref:Tissue inhibitor of metalloproteinase n=1 Tax=Acrocarpospora phusangensis TaxID=1070424 RepID=A0A919Q8U9_9ACTN|nr:hypothetical protein [Acrocarpospora phusangensis]GIH24644.1 hypothetical protein Aph01nite_29540 [Acrocarpospora phusangensis]